MHWWLGIKNVYNSGSNVMRCWGFRMSNYSWKAEGQLVSENNKSIFIVMKIHSPQTFWELNRIPLLQRAWWLRTDGNPSPEALGSSLSQFYKTSLSGPLPPDRLWRLAEHSLPTACGPARWSMRDSWTSHSSIACFPNFIKCLKMPRSLDRSSSRRSTALPGHWTVALSFL